MEKAPRPRLPGIDLLPQRVADDQRAREEERSKIAAAAQQAWDEQAAAKAKERANMQRLRELRAAEENARLSQKAAGPERRKRSRPTTRP